MIHRLPGESHVVHSETQRRTRTNRQSRSDATILRDRNKKWPRGTKRCSTCRRDLPFTSFSPRRFELDGLNRRCDSCFDPTFKETK